MARRAALAALTVVVLGIALVVLVPQFKTTSRLTEGGDGAADGSSADTSEPAPTPSSEELIGVALKEGDITYEESLLARAYALFDDPRLEPAFRSPIVNWEAMPALLDEIAEKEATLSAELLDDLMPFRLRPNDPGSIFNRPRAELLKAQTAATSEWVGLPVPGTDLMVWIQGTRQDLQRYVVMAGRIWRAFPSFFTYPLKDQPGNQHSPFNSVKVNPDDRIDIYLIDGAELDPRLGNCQDCSLGSNAGWAKADPAAARGARTSSGYVLVDKTRSDNDVTDTMAHELAHVSQMAYDADERRGGEMWMVESTATYVAYKVMLTLGIRPGWEYRLLDRKIPPPPGGPRWPAPPLFNNLHLQMHRTGNDYSGFLFFFYASQALGDGIVKLVWQQAAPQGTQGIDAVDRAVRMVDHFPRFTVRNWNQDPLPVQYKDSDGTFPRSLRPEPVKVMPSDLGTFELGEPVVNLSARYYRFEWPDPKVRKVTFQNLYKDLPNAHVWAIKKIGADWKEPEDWSRDQIRELCRESQNENVTELVLVVSNSDLRQPIPPNHPKPRVLVEDVGCEFIEGWAESTLRLRDGTQDVTYASSRANLRFKPRTVQDVPGKVEYDLLPTAVTWRVSGTRGDCMLSGQAVVTIPAFLDQPVDTTRPAWGYLNVVGLDGGDWHGVMVSAYDANSRMTVRCPGDPPTVTTEPFGAGWLLHVIHQANARESSAAVYKGPQTFDFARVQDNIPMTPGQALTILPNAPGVGGFITPEIQQALKDAQAALERNAAENSGKTVYTFRWELRPMSGTPPNP